MSTPQQEATHTTHRREKRSAMADRMRDLASILVDIPLANLKVSAEAQRTLRPRWSKYLFEHFNLELFGYPVVNRRADGSCWVIDGQHRIEALKQWLGQWEGQSVTCRVYSGLSLKEEADMFDHLNSTLLCAPHDRFRIRVTAERPLESDVQRICKNMGLKIRNGAGPGHVSCISLLTQIAENDGPLVLASTLKLAHDSFGDAGLARVVLDGMSRLVVRYTTLLDKAEVIERLRNHKGGVNSLLTRAELLHQQLGAHLAECLAAVIVEVINRAKRGPRKLPPWWKQHE